MITISVIVPLYNMAATLPSLLDSLARQSYPREAWEVLVVDNRSSDHPEAVLSQHSWVRVLRETDVQGSYAARNRAAAVARGELLAFTDADCVVSPEWLQVLARAFASPEVGAVAGSVGSLPGRTALETMAERWQLLDQTRFLRARPYPLAATANLTVRRSALERLGGFNSRLVTGGDFELCWRLQAELGLRLAHEPEAQVWHRHRISWRGLWRQSWRNGQAAVYLRARLPGYRLPAPRRATAALSLAEAAFLACRGLSWLGGLLHGTSLRLLHPVTPLPDGRGQR